MTSSLFLLLNNVSNRWHNPVSVSLIPGTPSLTLIPQNAILYGKSISLAWNGMRLFTAMIFGPVHPSLVLKGEVWCPEINPKTLPSTAPFSSFSGILCSPRGSILVMCHIYIHTHINTYMHAHSHTEYTENFPRNKTKKKRKKQNC